MKKRLFPLVLAASLLLSTPALAVTGSMENFVRSRTYEGQFSDLAGDSVFYDNVSALYEYGLSNGRPDGTYGLQAPITRGELFIFAGRIRSLYRTGDPEEGPAGCVEEGDEPLAARYLRYLRKERVVGAEVNGQFSLMPRLATRAETAHFLARVLPEKELPAVNEAVVEAALKSGVFFQDLNLVSTEGWDALRLYKAGICTGVDDHGSFRPKEPITRGAAAAMLTRLVDPSLRKTLTWEVPAEDPGQTPGQTPAQVPGNTPDQTPGQTPGNTPNRDPGQTFGGEIPAGTLPDRPSGEITYASLVEPGGYIPAPATGTEMDQAIRYMIASDTNKLTLNYGALSAVRARSVMNAALQVAKTYCEQSYNSVTCSYTEQGSITLTFTAGNADTDKTNQYRQATLEAALEVQSRLWAEGKLREDMTELERAEACYTWICESCEYDDTAGDNSVSHIPYSLFTRGIAVCDGYTGAYNLLLKLEGIQCMALANEDHIWTVAELDGRLVHIDTTWGDTVGSVPDYRYFAMTPEQSWHQHKW